MESILWDEDETTSEDVIERFENESKQTQPAQKECTDVPQQDTYELVG